MGSCAIIYTSRIIQTESGVEKLIGGIHIQTDAHRPEGDVICLLLFLQNMEGRAKNTF
jgi:hypothetical protein